MNTNQWAPSDLCLLLALEEIHRQGPHLLPLGRSQPSLLVFIWALQLSFYLSNDKSSLCSGLNPALLGLFSPSSLFRISLICLREDSGVPRAFLPGVLNLQSHTPLAPKSLCLCSLPFALTRAIAPGCAFVTCCGKGGAVAAQLKDRAYESNLEVKVEPTFLRASRRWPAGSQFTGSKKNTVLLPLSLGRRKKASQVPNK